MRTLLTILLFVGLVKNSLCCCATDDRTLTEILFNGQAGTIFTCKILTMTTPKYNEDTLVTKPIASNDTEAGRKKNRRVEFLITTQ